MVMLLRAGVKVAGAENSAAPANIGRRKFAALVAEACRAVGLARKIRVAVTDKPHFARRGRVLVPAHPAAIAVHDADPRRKSKSFLLLHELATSAAAIISRTCSTLREALPLLQSRPSGGLAIKSAANAKPACDALAIELSGATPLITPTLVQRRENILQPAPAAAPAPSATTDVNLLPWPTGCNACSSPATARGPAPHLAADADSANSLVACYCFLRVGTRSTVGAISPRIKRFPAHHSKQMRPSISPPQPTFLNTQQQLLTTTCSRGGKLVADTQTGKVVVNERTRVKAQSRAHCRLCRN